MKQTSKASAGYFDELAKITELRRHQADGLPGAKLTGRVRTPDGLWRPMAAPLGHELKVRKLPGRRSWSH